ncbi:MAG: rhamnulose-1-phosphate aldolase [Turicibacter sp.]|nr:rhamnulose-1-phosphate aldolase [Turicibacter sp.]
MKVCETNFMQGFIRLAADGYAKNWHELNGGNLSYRMTAEEVDEVREALDFTGEWIEIGASVPKLATAFFVTTGSGKFFGNVARAPKENLAIIEIDAAGTNYRIVWGLVGGGRPTSELPSHLMNHEVKMIATNGAHRVIYHAHPANLIALTFVLPLEDAVFTREIWEVMTECPVVFPEGIGVVPWMIPGGRDIAVATSELMKTYNIAVWAHHGLFVSGEHFDRAFGLMHTVEKASEILVKVLAMGGKRQTITRENFCDLAEAFEVTLDEAALGEK